ncbi:hypothetical protein K8R66_03315 [bacterium]|nr:hypothetical protein [bacterium]
MQKLSQLQEYILKKSLGCNNRGVDKIYFRKFYKNIKNQPKDIENIIIKSLNRLIARDLIVAFCKKTKHKTFINKVLLTSHGKKIAQKLFGTQKKLPIKYKSKNGNRNKKNPTNN